jgi:hypothetical protein
MATHYIYVNATLADPYPPALSDDEGHTAHSANDDKNMTTDVGPGDVVIWQATGDITELLDISYTGGLDLFFQPPIKQPNGTWRGVIGPNPKTPDDTEEEYNISYVVNNGVAYSQDPKIRLKPSIGS